HSRIRQTMAGNAHLSVDDPYCKGLYHMPNNKLALQYYTFCTPERT
ncbi:MAG: hypothetical protein ACI9P5_004291, partial [Saprospiraceae bacterium]